MPKKYRLSRADFKQMRGFARTHGRVFSFSVGTLPARNEPGVAIVVSKRVSGSAVKRNAIKRRAKAMLLGAMRKAHTPLVIVCTAKKGAAEVSASEARAELSLLLEKAVRGARG